MRSEFARRRLHLLPVDGCLNRVRMHVFKRRPYRWERRGPGTGVVDLRSKHEKRCAVDHQSTTPIFLRRLLGLRQPRDSSALPPRRLEVRDGSGEIEVKTICSAFSSSTSEWSASRKRKRHALHRYAAGVEDTARRGRSGDVVHLSAILDETTTAGIFDIGMSFLCHFCSSP